MKLDVEGAEPSILQAAPMTLAQAVAIKAEASFVAARKGPRPCSWRGEPGYSRGQIGQCDLLYFRPPDARSGTPQTLKAGLAAAALGYFDRAWPLLGGIP